MLEICKAPEMRAKLNWWQIFLLDLPAWMKIPVLRKLVGLKDEIFSFLLAKTVSSHSYIKKKKEDKSVHFQSKKELPVPEFRCRLHNASRSMLEEWRASETDVLVMPVYKKEQMEELLACEWTWNSILGFPVSSIKVRKTYILKIPI